MIGTIVVRFFFQSVTQMHLTHLTQKKITFQKSKSYA